MTFYCEHDLCEKSFEGSIKSGFETLFITQGIKAGFTPFTYPGEYVYNKHWFCPEHTSEGVENKKIAQEKFDEQEAKEEKLIQQQSFKELSDSVVSDKKTEHTS